MTSLLHSLEAEVLLWTSEEILSVEFGLDWTTLYCAIRHLKYDFVISCFLISSLIKDYQNKKFSMFLRKSIFPKDLYLHGRGNMSGIKIKKFRRERCLANREFLKKCFNMN